MASSQSTKVEKRAQNRKKGSTHTPRISTHRKSSPVRTPNSMMQSGGTTVGQNRVAPQRHGLTRVIQLEPYRPQIEQILEAEADMLVRDTYADHRQTVEERRVAREAEAHNFRIHQASMAKSSPAITALKKGSVAHKVALLVIEEFPLAEAHVKDGVRVNRTAAATEIALERLSDKEASREKAVKYGVSAARAALRGAYEKAKNNSNELINT